LAQTVFDGVEPPAPLDVAPPAPPGLELEPPAPLGVWTPLVDGLAPMMRPWQPAVIAPAKPAKMSERPTAKVAWFVTRRSPLTARPGNCCACIPALLLRRG
jgi:hypothetical protein